MLADGEAEDVGSAREGEAVAAACQKPVPWEKDRFAFWSLTQRRYAKVRFFPVMGILGIRRALRLSGLLQKGLATQLTDCYRGRTVAVEGP